MKLSHLSLAVFSAIALAACGGSGTSTPGGDPSKPDPSKPDPSKPDPSKPDSDALSKDVFAALTNVAGNGVRANNKDAVDAKLPDGQSGAGGTTIKVAAPLGSVLVPLATTNNDYIKNGDLYNASGNLDKFSPAVPVAQSTDVFYDDGTGNFVAAWIARAGAATNPVRYYKSDSAGSAVDLNAPLSASELYQQANASLTTVTGYKIFDQSQDRPSNSTTNYPELDRSKIKTGKIVDSDVTALVQYSAQKIAPVDSSGNAKTTNIPQTNSDDDGIVVQQSREFKVGAVKAYNLPHSFTTISLSETTGGLSNNGYFVGNYNNGGIQVSGLRTLDLPQNVSATYTGKVFTPKSHGDLSLDVSFGTTNSAYVKNVSISNRAEYGGTKLIDLKGQAPVAVNYSGSSASTDDYTVTLVGASGTTPTGVEYNSLGGKFYGPNAEETAGSVYKAASGVGAYSAQRGELKSTK